MKPIITHYQIHVNIDDIEKATGSILNDQPAMAIDIWTRQLVNHWRDLNYPKLTRIYPIGLVGPQTD